MTFKEELIFYCNTYAGNHCNFNLLQKIGNRLLYANGRYDCTTNLRDFTPTNDFSKPPFIYKHQFKNIAHFSNFFYSTSRWGKILQETNTQNHGSKIKPNKFSKIYAISADNTQSANERIGPLNTFHSRQYRVHEVHYYALLLFTLVFSNIILRLIYNKYKWKATLFS